MNVVDSSGWLEYFGEGKNARFFSRPSQDIENLIVPTICIYEVFKRLISLRDKEDALQAVGVMSLGQLIEVDGQLAMNAANFSLDLKLALADSIIFATARTYDAILWTQDEHFKDLENVKYVTKKA